MNNRIKLFDTEKKRDDPPYTIAGKRLYTFYDIDHEALFSLTSQIKGKYMLTYDDTPEIRKLADKYGLDYRLIPMKTTHHTPHTKERDNNLR